MLFMLTLMLGLRFTLEAYNVNEGDYRRLCSIVCVTRGPPRTSSYFQPSPITAMRCGVIGYLIFLSIVCLNVSANHIPSAGLQAASLVNELPPKLTTSGVASEVRGGTVQSLVPELDGKAKSILLSLFLALNSGFLNGVCLSGIMGKSQAVSAVTASLTNSARLSSKFLFQILASFFGGSLLAGLLNPRPKSFEVNEVAAPLSLAGAMMLGAMALVRNGNNVDRLLCLICAVNGLQNSVTSTLTGNLCRTSHYTGITSDMGTFAGQCLRGNHANIFKLKVFAGLATMFWVGGYLSCSVEAGLSALRLSTFLYFGLAFAASR